MSQRAYRILRPAYRLLVLAIVASTALIVLHMESTSTQLTAETSTQPSETNHDCLCKPSNKHYLLRLRPKPYRVPISKPDDCRKLIDLENFEFRIVNNNTCANVFLLVLVTSAVQNRRSRHTIRTTWARNDAKVKTFFILGATEDSKLQEAVEMENEVYGDIVQGNFVDSYKNLTYKTVMALKFVVYHCSRPIYILKTDDDVFVNMPLMKNYLTNDLSPFGAENFLQCHVMRNITILRNTRSKWAVTEEEFPGKEYPTYCNGPYAIFSPDVLFKLYQEAQNLKFFFLEDVFLYGVAASKFPEIKHTDTRAFTIWKYEWPGPSLDHTNFLFGYLSLAPEHMLLYWHYVTSRPVRSSIYDYSELSDN